MSGYTLDQVSAFARAHNRLEARRRRDDLVVARAAQAAEKGFRKVFSALEKDVG